MFVTGFGPFGEVAKNPSADLASGCGLPYEVLEVSFAAADEFIDRFRESGIDSLLMIGVAAKSERPRLELIAKNRNGARPDARGICCPGPIDPSAEPQLMGRLWPAGEENADRDLSVDAADYLCNYIYFRALQLLPNVRAGFLHVPPESALPLSHQEKILQGIIASLQALEALPIR